MMAPAPLFGLFMLALSAIVEAIPPIEAIGSKFFTSDGNQFFIKGIAYQLIEDDPLVNTTQCQLDANLMRELGANAIRVYHVDAKADHAGCMQAFADIGVYVFLDLDDFDTYIRYGTESSWTQNKSASYREVMDTFQQYDNTAGFLVGNEVLNSLVDVPAAPYLLSAAVDMKRYRDARGYRKIPIGYSATDASVLHPMLQNYLACRPDPLERLDFYAVNSYRWCGPETTWETSGYPGLQADAEGYPIPIWISETGCNTAPPRTFGDFVAILGPQMVDTWSGGMVYEWIQELNHYGLISYGPSLGADVHYPPTVIQGFTRQGVPTPVQPDFDNLKSQWATLRPTGVQREAYVASFSTTPPPCPTPTPTGWNLDPSAPLPTLGVDGVSQGTQFSKAEAPDVQRPESTTFISTSPVATQHSSTYSSTAPDASATTSGATSSSTSGATTGRGPPSFGDVALSVAVTLFAVAVGFAYWS